MNLVKKAVSLRPTPKSTKKKYSYNDEQIKLALSWVNNEVGIADVCRAMDMKVKNRAGAYNFLAQALKKHMRNLNNV